MSDPIYIRSGDSLVATNYISSLADYNFENRAESCCASGIWLLYSGNRFSSRTWLAPFFGPLLFLPLIHVKETVFYFQVDLRWQLLHKPSPTVLQLCLQSPIHRSPRRHALWHGQLLCRRTGSSGQSPGQKNTLTMTRRHKIKTMFLVHRRGRILLQRRGSPCKRQRGSVCNCNGLLCLDRVSGANLDARDKQTNNQTTRQTTNRCIIHCAVPMKFLLFVIHDSLCSTTTTWARRRACSHPPPPPALPDSFQQDPTWIGWLVCIPFNYTFANLCLLYVYAVVLPLLLQGGFPLWEGAVGPM